MGRLLVIAMVLAGCGRYGFDDMGGDPGGGGADPDPTGTTTTSPTSVTNPIQNKMVSICAVANTTTPLVASGPQNLAITPTPTGATLFATAEAGGSLYGLNVDAAFDAAAAPALVVSGTYTNASTNYVDGKLIAAFINNARVLVNIVTPDLSTATQIGNLDGMYVAKDALLDANGDRITPTSCSAGLTVNPWDASWNPTTSQLTVTTSQSTGIASTPFATDAMVVWSTASECHTERVTSFAAGTGAMQSWPCTSPRIAANAAASTGMLTYEATDGVRAATFTNTALSGSTVLVAPGATSPRVVFDGTVYWGAYIDASGAVVVGFLDANNTLQATTTDLTPSHDGYELAIVDGKLWVVASDAAGVAARQICYQ
jgi:hypothetical protein